MKPVGHRPITGRQVFVVIAAFFGIVIAVNAVFVYVATSSWTGVATENAYVKGLDYNATLRDAEAQDALGWAARLRSTAEADGATRISTEIRAGELPVRGLAVEAVLRRPTDAAADRTVTLYEARRGVYDAVVDLPLKGQWDVEVTARNAAGDRYRLRRRIWVK